MLEHLGSAWVQLGAGSPLSRILTDGRLYGQPGSYSLRPTGQDRLFWLSAVPSASSFGNCRSSAAVHLPGNGDSRADRKSTRLNSSHLVISYAVFCLKKK